jgi:hypothetical protein
MATYLIGLCPECNSINAAAYRLARISDDDWKQIESEFKESGLITCEVVRSDNVVVEECSDTCKRGKSRNDPTGIKRVEAAIRDYHFALDSREHGGVAQDKAIKAIESALNLHWRPGEELARRKAL